MNKKKWITSNHYNTKTKMEYVTFSEAARIFSEFTTDELIMVHKNGHFQYYKNIYCCTISNIHFTNFLCHAMKIDSIIFYCL